MSHPALKWFSSWRTACNLQEASICSEAHGLFNHTLPVLGILQNPSDTNIQVLVRPLYRPVLQPGFETIGEVFDFIHQAFIGLRHVHRLNIVLNCRSISLQCDSIVMIPSPAMYPESYHFMRPRFNPTFTGRVHPAGPRTVFPAKYYWRLPPTSRRIDPNHPNAKHFFAQDVASLGRMIFNELMGAFWMPFIIKFPGFRAISHPSDSHITHPNPYPKSLNEGYLSRHLLADPHRDPLSVFFLPGHPRYDPNPLSRLLENMAHTPVIERPTIYEAVGALERVFISISPPLPSSTGTSLNTPDLKSHNTSSTLV
ncbi:hypothetical protein CPB83DRAFT_893290 [Crepidotus variabilis]|uniref:Protein kinase domain-containing protein n=1 Tax=Crepidotus variabilis TaxID=179855 RepID=A0A9P6EJG2_9AGAR|nr:hypothetical protein CPB83DRAFT_893290 [Crepidotus variabilis]